jgi:transcriptional regulator with PAS, ATPase and Fis domain
MMHRVTTDSLRLAHELREAKRFTEVIETLGEIDLNSVSPKERVSCNLLFVEANLSLSRNDVGDKLDEALADCKKIHDNVKFAWAKHLQGWLMMAQGDRFDAREVLQESYAMYKRYDCWPEQARVLSRLGFLCFQLGDIQASEGYLKKSIAIFGDLQDSINRYKVGGNLAVVYRQAGYLRKSISNYSEIEKYLSKLGTNGIAIHYMQSSIPLALCGDVETARKTLEKAWPFLDGLFHEQALYMDIMGRINMRAGGYSEARDWQMKGLKLTQEKTTDRGLIRQIHRLLGESLIGLHHDGEARVYTDQALAGARRKNERQQIAGCYRNLGVLEARQGNMAKSREWFKRSLDLFNMTQMRYELAVTQYQAAISGIYQDAERHALLYLAGEYFKSEGVADYVALISIELKDRHTTSRPAVTGDNDKPLEIVTVNDAMKRQISMAEHVAASDMSVLLTGETGTGKDLFARYIHRHSGRGGRFVSINAAAIPDSMVESELFGHRKGSFTNADRDKVGLIEVAHGGTLYLNEIADASKELQAKLLDVLENHRVRRLGETKERRVDFRLIAATNHDLNRLISDGKFRIDLYHRISEVPFSLSLLGERLEDIRPLLSHFLSGAGVTVDENCPEFDQLVKLLTQREWPGNVRQLEAEAKRLALLSGGQVARMYGYVSQHKLSERDRLLDLLHQTGWNRREVARKLCVSDTTIRRKIKKYRLDER